MKQSIIVILGMVVLMSWGCKSQQKVTHDEVVEETEATTTTTDNDNNDTAIQETNEFGMPKLLDYQPTFIDIGEIKRGEKRDIVFDYTNISDEIVEIELVTACSCTETDFTKETVAPGEKGQILLTFDSTSKEKSEVIDVDIILKNTDPETDYPIVDRVQFKYELLQ